MRFKTVLLFLCAAILASAQPLINPPVHYYGYDGSGNELYDCATSQSGPGATWSVAASTLTNIVVTTNSGVITFAAAPGLYVGAQLTFAASATTALNATYVVTAVSGSTATITTAGVSNGTYTDMTITTGWPLLTQAIWSIQRFVYNASSQLLTSYYAQAGSTNNQPFLSNGFVCANALNY